MKIVRRRHPRLDDGPEVVRFHVVDDDGRCVPEACVGKGGLCGHPRLYQARQALIRYRADLEAIAAAGSRW